MKVLYEISNLGFTFDEVSWRTGIFRVSDALLRHLTALPEIDAALASFFSFYGEAKAAEYLQHEMPHLLPRLRNVWRNPIRCLAAVNDVAARVPPGEDAEAFRQRSRLRRELNERLELPLNEPFDILHSFQHALPPRERVAARARILHVHDVIPLLLPDAITDLTRVNFEQWFASIDRQRDWIITISECSKRDFCDHTGMTTERVFVVPNAADPSKFYRETDAGKMRRTLRQHGIADRPYILGLSALEPRKNLMHLIECFFALCRDGGAGDSQLVLVGPNGWMFEPTFERWRREQTFRERVVFTGFVPDADLSSIYSGARLFVYVSRYEGFGLPPLEAMACGVPTVVSDNSALPEVVGDAALLVNPEDRTALCDVLRRLLADDALCATLAARGLARAQSYSWERSAARVLEVYRTVCEAS